MQVPPLEAFPDAEDYYATLAHELTHNATRYGSTGILGARAGATKAMRSKSLWPS